MTDQPVEFRMSQCAGALLAAQLRISELEHILRHFDRTSMDLHHYVRGIESRPSQVEWLLIKDQIAEMVDAYGPRNPDR